MQERVCLLEEELENLQQAQGTVSSVAFWPGRETVLVFPTALLCSDCIHIIDNSELFSFCVPGSR